MIQPRPSRRDRDGGRSWQRHGSRHGAGRPTGSGSGSPHTPRGHAALAWAMDESMARGARLTICRAGNDGHPHVAPRDLTELELRQPVLTRQLRTTRQRLDT